MDGKKHLREAFPIGVRYGRFRGLEEEEQYWDQDFEKMRECGIDTIRLHAYWGKTEPVEGTFDFSLNDRLVEKAASYGIKTVFTLYLESAPEWIFEKHPDSRYVSATGTVWNSNQFPDNAHGGWPGLCYDGQKVRQTVENFIKAFVTHYKGNKNILAMDVGHEATDEPAQQYAQGDWHELQYCYCEHSKARFRKWMEKKYGSLEGINKAWSRYYSNLDQLEPPRQYGHFTEWLDWKNFRMEAIAERLTWLSNLVKKYDPEMSTAMHAGIYEIQHPSLTDVDHFKEAKTTDMFGCSMYDTMRPEVPGFTCDLMRSACENQGYWIGETATGSGPMFIFFGEDPEGYFPYSRPTDPPELRRLIWGMIARGAKGILFWSWRPETSTMETLSLGLTERNGDWTDRLDMVKDFTSVFRKHKEELADSYSPQSDVAIFYSIDAVIQEGFVSLAGGGATTVRLDRRYFKDTLSFLGCYKLCTKNGIQTDFVDKEQISAGNLSKYKVLLLPYSINIGEETAKAIKEFVANGGKVISDAMCGFFTDGGWGSEVCPPHGLSDVFGLHTKSNYTLITTCDVTYDGKTFPEVGKFLSERIVPHDGAVVEGTFDGRTPAILSNSYGKGKAVYIGMMYFCRAIDNDLEVSSDVFKKLLELADYRNPTVIEGTTNDGIVEVRKLVNENSEYVFVINHSKQEENVLLRVPLKYGAKVTNILSGHKVENSIRDGALALELKMPPDDVQIYQVSAK